MSAIPFVLNGETAPAFWLVETLWLILAAGAQTGNRLSLMEQVMPTGLGPPTHRHPYASEGFYVLEGTCAFNAEGQTLQAGPGTFVHLPRLMPHSFSVDTADARVLNFYTPAGFELVVIGCARPALSAAARQRLRATRQKVQSKFASCLPSTARRRLQHFRSRSLRPRQ